MRVTGPTGRVGLIRKRKELPRVSLCSKQGLRLVARVLDRRLASKDIVLGHLIGLLPQIHNTAQLLFKKDHQKDQFLEEVLEALLMWLLISSEKDWLVEVQEDS